MTLGHGRGVNKRVLMIVNHIKKLSIMKTIRHLLAAAAVMTAGSASAQWYQAVSQIPSLISPALSGSLSYKGFVESSFTGGFGNDWKANILSISTSQGFTYSSWFFMGAGIGADILFRGNELGDYDSYPGYYPHSQSSTRVMMPVFSDFRFTFGGGASGAGTGVYIDVKLGATFLFGDTYMQFPNGYLTDNTYFYLKPSVGVRIPVGSGANSRQAVSLGVAYQLITGNNGYVWYGGNSVAMNSIGACVSFEW